MDDAARRGDFPWRVAGYLNDRLEPGSDLEGHPVLGRLDDLPRFLARDYHFLYTIYRIDGQDLRLARFDSLGLPEARLATVVHPSAYVAGQVELGPGCVIMPHACLSPGTRLGPGCLVMAGATVGHNDVLGRCCHIAAQACLGAYLTVGQGVHVGLNATVRENLTLGDRSTLGMGAVLLNDMGPDEIWAGVPARLLRHARKEL